MNFPKSVCGRLGLSFSRTEIVVVWEISHDKTSHHVRHATEHYTGAKVFYPAFLSSDVLPVVQKSGHKNLISRGSQCHA